jgi:hypothetical protein
MLVVVASMSFTGAGAGVGVADGAAVGAADGVGEVQPDNAAATIIATIDSRISRKALLDIIVTST